MISLICLMSLKGKKGETLGIKDGFKTLYELVSFPIIIHDDIKTW